MKSHVAIYASRVFLVIFIALLTLSSSSVSALVPSEYPANGIYFYSPTARLAECTIGAGASTGSGSISTGNGANGNKDYKGRPIFTDDQLAKIKQFQPVYEEAGKKANIPWQALAVVHVRETNLLKGNPGPSSDGRLQGIYQDSAQSGALDKNNPYPQGPVSDEEFLRQTIWAANFLKEKAGSKADMVAKGDTEAIKDMFFSYNGRAPIYTVQAIKIGFHQGYEGSPYVMNKADAKRDPDVAKDDGTWGQIMTDGGDISYPAGGDYGAFVMYAALAGIPATSGSGGDCTSGGSVDSRVGANGWPSTGPNAMVVFYQDLPPWNDVENHHYGIGSIQGCGCGPTSTAMAIATLNKLPEDKMNPQIMADFFYKNGGQIGGGNCGSFLPTAGSEIGSALSTTYDVTITELGTDFSKAAEAVKRGSFVLTSTDLGGGHILLIRGVTDDGKYLVADPSATGGWLGQSNAANGKNTENEKGFTSGEMLVKGLYEIRKS